MRNFFWFRRQLFFSVYLGIDVTNDDNCEKNMQEFHSSLGTVIPSAASLPGLPTRVSLISDSLPVYTGQMGLAREWLCMGKISYLWEGVGWAGVDVIEVW